MSEPIDKLKIEVESDSSSAVKGLDSLAASLGKLKQAAQGGLGLTSVINNLKKLGDATKGVDESSASKVTKMAQALSDLGKIGNVKISASVANQLNKIGSALKNISDDDVKRVNTLSQALSTLGSVNVQGSASQVNSLARSVNKLGDTSNITTQTNSAVKAGNKLTNFFGGLKNNAMNVYASLKMGYAAVSRLSDMIGGFISHSTQYVEDLNLFHASLGKYSDEAQAYAEKVGEILGIDPGQWMRNQGIFNTILTGFGVVEDRAYLMSQQLTQLGYDISSFFNLSYEESMAKLESGIAGELEPLRRIGYDLSVARLQQEAYALGIDRSVSSMNQAEKAELRYHAIMTQVIDSHGDMARTLQAPANQLRVLQAQLDMAAREIGNIFIPALNLILPYAIAAVKAIRTLASEVARFFGFELPEVDYSSLEAMKAVNAEAVDLGDVESGIADTAADIADSAGDLGDGLGDAAKQAKKLKTYMIGIDELNVLSQPDDILSSVSTSNGKTGKTGSSGSGGSGGATGAGVSGGSGLGIDLPTYDFLGDAIARNIDDVTSELRSKIQGALDSFGEIITVVSLASIGVGLLLVLTGNFLLGIGMIVAGAAMLAATVVKWDDGKSTKDKLIEYLGTFAVFTGLALVGLGLLLTATGNVPVGLGLVIGGIAALAVGSAIFKTQDNDTYNKIKSYLIPFATYGGLAAVGLGMLLMVIGKPLIGLGLVLTGAALLATAAVLQSSDNDLKNNIIKFLQTFATYGGLALFGLGVIMLLLPGHRLLGLGMMVAGAAAIAIGSTDFSDGSDIKSKLTQILANMLVLAGMTAFTLGVILCFIPGFLLLGLGLIALGATALTASGALNATALTNEVNSKITDVNKKINKVKIVGTLIDTFAPDLEKDINKAVANMNKSNSPTVKLTAGLVENSDEAIRGDVQSAWNTGVGALKLLFSGALDKNKTQKTVKEDLNNLVNNLGVTNAVLGVTMDTVTQKATMTDFVMLVKKEAEKKAKIEYAAIMQSKAADNLSKEVLNVLASLPETDIMFQMYADSVGGVANLKAMIKRMQDERPEIEVGMDIQRQALENMEKKLGSTKAALEAKDPIKVLSEMAYVYGGKYYDNDQTLIKKVTGNLQNYFNNEELLTQLGIDKNKLKNDASEQLKFLDKVFGAEANINAVIGADVTQADKKSTALLNTLKKEYGSAKIEAILSAKDLSVQDKAKQLSQLLYKATGGEYTFTLTGDNELAVQTGKSTFNQMNEYARTVKPYTLNAKDNATKTTKEVTDTINSTYPKSKTCTLNATDKTTTPVNNAKKFITDNITQPWYNANLGANNNTSTGINKATDSVKKYSQGTYSATLGAKNGTSTGINKATESVTKYGQGTYSATLGVKDNATESTNKIVSTVGQKTKTPKSITINSVDKATDSTQETYNKAGTIVKNPLTVSLQSAWGKDKGPVGTVNTAKTTLANSKNYMTGYMRADWVKGDGYGTRISGAKTTLASSNYYMTGYMGTSWLKDKGPVGTVNTAKTTLSDSKNHMTSYMGTNWLSNNNYSTKRKDGADWLANSDNFMTSYMYAAWSAVTNYKTKKNAGANWLANSDNFMTSYMYAAWSAVTNYKTNRADGANWLANSVNFMTGFLKASMAKGFTTSDTWTANTKNLGDWKKEGYLKSIMASGYTASDTWSATTKNLPNWKKEGYLKSVMASGFTAADTWTANTKNLANWKKDGYIQAVMANKVHQLWDNASANLATKYAKIMATVEYQDAMGRAVVNLPYYAAGGFPEEGQMFVAREAGAEMVGTIGHRTAVANNEEIVAAVSAGVYEAVSAAMSGNKDGGTQDITINLDGEVIYKNQQKIAANKGYNFNQGAFA